MFSSTIIPTIGRASLSRSVWSVLDQNFDADDYEVIVVNDSGRPLPLADWQQSDRVRVIDTNCRERSVARNTGAAIAKGKYLHFLDDDDTILPQTLDTLWRLDRQSDAIWLYGSYQTVDNAGNIVNEFHPELKGDIFPILVAGESIPFQVSLLNNQHFFNAGGFDPDRTLLGVEDRDLGRRLALRGSVAYTPVIVAQIRIGEEGSTTNWKIIAEGDRWGREKALSMQHVFAHIRRSDSSPYWIGRVCRAYIASGAWNLSHKNFWVAIGRLFAGIFFFIPNVFSLSFWEGLRKGNH